MFLISRRIIVNETSHGCRTEAGPWAAGWFCGTSLTGARKPCHYNVTAS